MKFFDKLLKNLKTDRNSFLTYICGLISIFIIVDRLTEFLLIVFTGVASDYWGPIAYTIALIFPVLTYNFSISSKYVKSDRDKHKLFYYYCIVLYILVITMVTEWINMLCWIGILSLPGYVTIATEFSYLIKPALSSIAIALPLCTWHLVFNKLYKGVEDSKLLKDSITDYGGFNLSNTKIGWGPYTSEIFIGSDTENGKSLKLPEAKRFEPTLVVGVSGAGKTSLIFEPWCAQDINKKFFYRESSKTLAYTALRTGLATLTAPYSNDYLNHNFSLNMITPVESKAGIYKTYLKKMIYSDNASKLIYRDLGITYMAPDNETIDRIKGVCENFGIRYNLIDPEYSSSIGLNPFTFNDPAQTASCITTVLKGFYTDKNPEMEMAYRENLSNQIIENLSILLKIVYPKLNNGSLPNIDDLLKLLNNFELIEKMCKILEQDSELSEQYANQIGYFRKNFFKDSPNRAEMQKLVTFPMAQLDTLLRYPGVKAILCNRTNNMNYDRALANGEVTLVCTRRGDLGENAHRAFGLFFLLLMQFSVLRRPGNESTRIPHYLYIDEFSGFICPAVEPLFTQYRKYRVGMVVSAQNLSQLRSRGEKMGDTIIANCSNKIVFGNNSPEDNEWWAQELGNLKQWWIDNKSYDFEKNGYKNQGTAINVPQMRYKPGKIQSLKFKMCFIKIRDLKGGYVNGIANLDFIPEKYKQKQNIKSYNFVKYAGGMNNDKTEPKSSRLINTHFTDSGDYNVDPIKLDTSDLNFDENSSGDAITNKFKQGS